MRRAASPNIATNPLSCGLSRHADIIGRLRFLIHGAHGHDRTGRLTGAEQCTGDERTDDLAKPSMASPQPAPVDRQYQ
jgi:hypothetical protein